MEKNSGLSLPLELHHAILSLVSSEDKVNYFIACKLPFKEQIHIHSRWTYLGNYTYRQQYVSEHKTIKHTRYVRFTGPYASSTFLQKCGYDLRMCRSISGEDGCISYIFLDDALNDFFVKSEETKI